MKVCTLTHTYPRFVGDINAPFVEHLMEHIAREDVEVSVLTAYDPEWNRKKEEKGIELRTYRYIWPERFHILGYSRTIEGNVRFKKRMLLLSPLLFIFAFIKYFRQVRKKKPDVLHAHWILPNGFISALVSLFTRVPLLIQLHGSDVFTAEKNILFRLMALFAASKARYIVSPSQNLTERLNNLSIFKKNKITNKTGFVPNTVQANFLKDVTDEKVTELRKKHGIPEGSTVLLAMGRMVYVKGFDYLLKAFKKVAQKNNNAILILAGGGVLFDEMKKLAKDLEISDRVIMPGAVMRNEVPVYFKLADMFIIPSITHESGAVDGLPVVVPEAMAASLTIIASKIGGIPDLVKDGELGILVEERNTEELANAMTKLINEPNLRDTYGKKSRLIIENTVNYTAVAKHFVKIYNAIIDKKLSVDSFPKFDIFIK